MSLDISRALRASRGEVLVGGEGGEWSAGLPGGDAPAEDRSSLLSILTYSTMRASKSAGAKPETGPAGKNINFCTYLYLHAREWKCHGMCSLGIQVVEDTDWV